MKYLTKQLIGVDTSINQLKNSHGTFTRAGGFIYAIQCVLSKATDKFKLDFKQEFSIQVPFWVVNPNL